MDLSPGAVRKSSGRVREKVVGKVIGKVVGKEVGKVVGKVVGRVVGKDDGRVVGSRPRAVQKSVSARPELVDLSLWT